MCTTRLVAATHRAGGSLVVTNLGTGSAHCGELQAAVTANLRGTRAAGFTVIVLAAVCAGGVRVRRTHRRRLVTAQNTLGGGAAGCLAVNVLSGSLLATTRTVGIVLVCSDVFNVGRAGSNGNQMMAFQCFGEVYNDLYIGVITTGGKGSATGLSCGTIYKHSYLGAVRL